MNSRSTTSVIKPKFGHVIFREGIEPSQLRLKSLDVSLRDLLDRILTPGGDENSDTVVFLLSEQGVDAEKTVLPAHEGVTEQIRPFFFLITPTGQQSSNASSTLLSNYYHNLLKNQDRLVTAQDIYNTLVSLADNTMTGHLTNSLFHPLPLNRKCTTANISPALCECTQKPDLWNYFFFLPLPLIILTWWCYTWFRNRHRRLRKQRKKEKSQEEEIGSSLPPISMLEKEMSWERRNL